MSAKDNYQSHYFVLSHKSCVCRDCGFSVPFCQQGYANKNVGGCIMMATPAGDLYCGRCKTDYSALFKDRCQRTGTVYRHFPTTATTAQPTTPVPNGPIAAFAKNLADSTLERASCGPEKKCECGAKKTGVPDFYNGHSHWCPVASKA